MAGGPEKLLQLDDVELAFSRGSAKDRRKYLTLIEETGTRRRGGLGEISRVRTMVGEVLACKKLLLPDREAFGSKDAYEAEVVHRERAFREEYDVLCRLGNFKGFVKARAYGQLGDTPLILMEWVEGVSVGSATAQLKDSPSDAGANPLCVAEIGRDVFHLLARLEAETELFVHRDLSSSNIMIRTSERPLDQQISDGRFDICFIDFGSAATLRSGDGTFTTDTRILRGATPGYAPPEMLSHDLPRLDELRKSTKIDVYAASSVLYEMLCGHVPFDVAGRTGSGSDYLFKMMNDPAPTGFAEGSVEQLLADIICRGICATQDARCSSYAMYRMLDHYADHYAENCVLAAEGAQLEALNPRAIDRPDFGVEWAPTSNPPAGSVRKAGDAARPPAAETAVMTQDRGTVASAETVALAPGQTRVASVSAPSPRTRAMRTASSAPPRYAVPDNRAWQVQGGAAGNQPYSTQPPHTGGRSTVSLIAVILAVFALIAVIVTVLVVVLR